MIRSKYFYLNSLSNVNWLLIYIYFVFCLYFKGLYCGGKETKSSFPHLLLSLMTRWKKSALVSFLNLERWDVTFYYYILVQLFNRFLLFSGSCWIWNQRSSTATYECLHPRFHLLRKNLKKTNLSTELDKQWSTIIVRWRSAIFQINYNMNGYLTLFGLFRINEYFCWFWFRANKSVIK